MTEKIVATVVQPVPSGLPPTSHILAVLIGFDILVNACFGGRAYQTISSRLGENMRSGGWASKLSWPAWWVAHCEGAVYTTEV